MTAYEVMKQVLKGRQKDVYEPRSTGDKMNQQMESPDVGTQRRNAKRMQFIEQQQNPYGS